MGDAQSGAIHRYEAVHPALELPFEQVLHAAKIAETFFADGPHERNRPGRLDSGFVHGADHANEDGQATAVVRDSGPLDDAPLPRRPDVRALRKHGVQVRAEYDVRPGGGARALAQHVSDRVDPDVLQSKSFEGGLQRRGSLLFLERRRFDLAEPHLLLDDGRLVPARRINRCLDRGCGDQPVADRRGLILTRAPGGGRYEQTRGDQQGFHARHYAMQIQFVVVWNSSGPQNIRRAAARLLARHFC